jgi:hypothetical protein
MDEEDLPLLEERETGERFHVIRADARTLVVRSVRARYGRHSEFTIRGEMLGNEYVPADLPARIEGLRE